MGPPRGDASTRSNDSDLEDPPFPWQQSMPPRSAISELAAQLAIDDTLPRGSVVLRDIAGVAPSEIVHVIKPDLDAPPEHPHYA